MTGSRNSIWLAASLVSTIGLTSSVATAEPFKTQLSTTEMHAAPAPAVKTGEPAILVSWLKKPAHSQFVPYTSFRHLGSVATEPRVSEAQAIEYAGVRSCVDAGLLKAPSFANEAISCEELAPEKPDSVQVHIAQSFAAKDAGAAE